MDNKNNVIVKNAFPIGFCEGEDGEKTKYNLRIASVPISELEIDHNYQRVACSNVRKLSKNWDEKKCDPLYVSYRKNKFFIMDGQHRYLVAKEKGLTYIPCIISTGLSEKEEAKIFVDKNTTARKLSVYDAYKGNLLYGEPTDTAIEKLLSSKGLKIIDTNSRSLDKKKIGGITELRTIVEQLGIKCLDWILNIIADCGWDSENNGYDVAVIRMIKQVYLVYYKTDMLEKARKEVIRILHKTTPSKYKTHAMIEYDGLKERKAMYTYLKDNVRSALEVRE